MANSTETHRFNDADKRYIDEHLHAVARRLKTVAGDDRRDGFEDVKYLMRRLGELMLLESNSGVSYIALMRLFGQSAASNVIDTARELIRGGNPDWDEIGAALSIEGEAARKLFLGT